MRGALIAAAAGLGAAAPPATFEYSPQPRWTEDPETEVVCAAIRAECRGVLKDDSIDADWSYAEVYNVDGMLVGLKSTQSTGCKPLDEHMLLSHRHFRGMFSGEGKPDLDDIRVELKPGTPQDAVRLVKTGSTQVSMGC